MAIRVRLQQCLDERDMTQVELQLKTRLSYSTINELAHGKTQSVRFATLDAICAALGCGVDDLLEYVPDTRRRRS